MPPWPWSPEPPPPPQILPTPAVPTPPAVHPVHAVEMGIHSLPIGRFEPRTAAMSGRAWPAQKLIFLKKMAFLRIILFKTLSSQYTSAA